MVGVIPLSANLYMVNGIGIPIAGLGTQPAVLFEIILLGVYGVAYLV